MQVNASPRKSSQVGGQTKRKSNASRKRLARALGQEVLIWAE